MEHMDAADRDSPSAHPVQVHFRLSAQPGDGIAYVLLLLVQVEVVAGLTPTAAIVPVVEDQHCVAGSGKTLGVARQRDLFYGADRVRHDDARGLSPAFREVIRDI